jgi:FKBP-type peptidyl-prolyl cis-trans isomerase SlyD
MQIAENKVVAIDYTLKDDSGQVLDTSEGREPLSYLHGTGGIIPGLEQELAGKEAGDELHVAVAPADAYGERNEALRQQVSREQFQGIDNLAPGMQFRVKTEGGPLVVTVTEVADEVVTIDGNHPLAGVNLNFAVKVRDVREATAEEITHGHVHGPDGHAH